MMKPIWKLPVPSTSLLGAGVAFKVRLGREISLQYDIEGATGEPHGEALVFEGVESFKCTYGQACQHWMLSAYDQLIELTDSVWAMEVASQLQGATGVPCSLRHLAIY